MPQENEDICQKRKRGSHKGTETTTCKKVLCTDSNQGTVKDRKRQSATSFNALGGEKRWDDKRLNGTQWKTNT